MQVKISVKEKKTNHEYLKAKLQFREEVSFHFLLYVGDIFLNN